jgi:hypothetical protein
MIFDPHTIKLTGTLYDNCIYENRLSDEVWEWLFDHCSGPNTDRFYYYTGYTPGRDTHYIRFDYREHSNWFLLRWS